jgi:hypothetical protein
LGSGAAVFHRRRQFKGRTAVSCCPIFIEPKREKGPLSPGNNSPGGGRFAEPRLKEALVFAKTRVISFKTMPEKLLTIAITLRLSEENVIAPGRQGLISTYL